MNTKLIILIAFAIVGSTLQQAPNPKPAAWANNWMAKFNDTSYYFLQGNRTVSGTFKYQNDGTNKRMRISRSNGRNDRYCGTVFPFSNTPCDMLIVNSNRYLIFQEKNYCCKCCTSAQGCGVITQDWAANATFEGASADKNTNYFLIKGLQNNWYWQTADGKPSKIYMEPVSDMVFDTSSYSTTPLNDADFAKPDSNSFGDCEKSCPFLSTCTLVKFA